MYNPDLSTAWSLTSFSFTNLGTKYDELDWNKSLGCIDYCMQAWPLCRYVSRTITERQNENTRLNHKVDKLYNSSSVLHVHVYCLSFILRALSTRHTDYYGSPKGIRLKIWYENKKYPSFSAELFITNDAMSIRKSALFRESM